VLKADFKRRPDDSLALLEVNPRFSLWHALGAKAGVNIPAFVLADLLGRPRPTARQARPGVTWCDPRADLDAARELGVSRARWLRWLLLECDVRSGSSIRDPLPFVRRLLPGG
jgi:predicted ATP-grasp superfamily ATP-dependent carboligase